MYTTTDYAKVHNDYRRELLHRSYTHHDRHHRFVPQLPRGRRARRAA
jgi:hypothetical protein